MTEVTWLVPLLLIPGVALLIMSTSVRFGQVRDEVHYLFDRMHIVPPMFLDGLYQRARYYRNSLIGLYFAVGCFATGSILGAVVDFMRGNVDFVVLVFTALGIGGLLYASVTLIRESYLLLEVIEQHIDEIRVETGKQAEY